MGFVYMKRMPLAWVRLGLFGIQSIGFKAPYVTGHAIVKQASMSLFAIPIKQRWIVWVIERPGP